MKNLWIVLLLALCACAPAASSVQERISLSTEQARERNERELKTAAELARLQVEEKRLGVLKEQLTLSATLRANEHQAAVFALELEQRRGELAAAHERETFVRDVLRPGVGLTGAILVSILMMGGVGWLFVQVSRFQLASNVIVNRDGTATVRTRDGYVVTERSGLPLSALRVTNDRQGGRLNQMTRRVIGTPISSLDLPIQPAANVQAASARNKHLGQAIQQVARSGTNAPLARTMFQAMETETEQRLPDITVEQMESSLQLEAPDKSLTWPKAQDLHAFLADVRYG